jgi:cyclohexanecarboxylate-CoA ligase
MIRAGTLWELVEQRAEATPDLLIAVDEEGRQITFGEYRRQAEEVAAAFHQAGVGEGMIVSWQIPNWIETFVMVAALARLGVVQNPIAPLFRRREVGFITQQVNSDLLIVPTQWQGFDYEAMALDIQAAQPQLRVQLLPGKDSKLPRADPSTLPPVPTTAAGEPAPVRWIFYTSGTTSDPKGARHTDRGFEVTASNIARCMRQGENDRNALVFPFAHIGGTIYVFGNLITGACSIMIERFGPDAIPILGREGVTIAGVAVPFFREYLKAQAKDPSRPIFPHLKVFVGGGSTRPPGLSDELKEVFGVPLLSGYGLTEAGSFAMTSMDDSEELQIRTEGRPYPEGEIRILDPDGTILGPDQEGEVCLRGPQLMYGYVDASLDVAFDEDRFFHTGDLGTLDEDGFLVITGRIKDIIIRKGENISAREVEDLLSAHPLIEEVVVIGLPHPDTGEQACAAVLLKDKNSSLTLEDLKTFLVGQGLAKYKVPERLEIVTEFQRGIGGKVFKPLLKEQFSATAAAGPGSR